MPLVTPPVSWFESAVIRLACTRTFLGNAQTGASSLAGFLDAPTCNVRVAPSTSTYTMPCICGCSFAHNLCVFPSGELIVNSPFHPSRELRCFSSCHFPVPIAESDFCHLLQVLGHLSWYRTSRVCLTSSSPWLPNLRLCAVTVSLR